MPGEERVVSEQVLGSSNPVARFGRTVSNSVSGIFFGILLLIVSFGLVWWGEHQPEYSKIVAALPLMNEVPATQTGLVKIQTVPVIAHQLVEPKTSTPVIYYQDVKQEYKKVKQTKQETRTVQQNGQDVQQTLEHDEYVDQWVDVSTEKKWAPFTLSKLGVDGTSADLHVTFKKLFADEQPIVGAAQPPAGATPDMYPPTKTREIIEGISVGTKLLVVGEAADGMISGGKPFIISDKSNDALITEMKTSESRTYWALKFAAWLFMTIGFVMLFGPIAALLNILPGLGKAFNGLLFVVFAVVSVILVALGTIVIRYWWATLIILAALIVVAVAKLKNRTTHA